MKKILIILNLFLFSVSADQIWITDFDSALKKAKENDKYLLIEFSGSDWCPPCIRLNDEVFETSEWKIWAKENVVSVLIDFPRSGQSSEEKKKNELVAKNLNITHFPTIVILSKDNKEMFRTGYKSGGPKKYISHLENLALKSSFSF